MADKKKWRERREQPGGFGSVVVETRVVAGDKPSPDAVEVPEETAAHGWESNPIPQAPGVGA